MTREWSRYQTAVFHFGEFGTGSAIVNAVAGSGKTSTIEEMTRRLPSHARIRYLVFNKRNADEAKMRMPENVSTSTFHSASNAGLARAIGRYRVEAKKTGILIDDMVRAGTMSPAEKKFLGWNMAKLVGLAKNAGLGFLRPDSLLEWRNLQDHFDVVFFDDPAQHGTPERTAREEDRVLAMCADLLRTSYQRLDLIDYDDMLAVPAMLNVPFAGFDIVCLDEAQDTNAVQRAVLESMVGRSRLVAVGDPQQAIYGFRGADANAMKLILDEFKCKPLPLNVNYRCSRAVVRAAREYCPVLESWPGAEEGSVVNMAQCPVDQFAPGDGVLCRYNAPIVGLAYKLIRARKPAFVLGRDIGAGLMTLIDQMRARGIDDLSERLDRYKLNEAARLQAAGKEDKVQSVLDRVDAIEAIIEGLPVPERNIDGLKAVIQSLFVDTMPRDAVTLSTIHKAKGLEWDRVFIVDHSTEPSKSRHEWQRQQERNLIYVAYTRARKHLILLGKDATK